MTSGVRRRLLLAKPHSKGKCFKVGPIKSKIAFSKNVDIPGYMCINLDPLKVTKQTMLIWFLAR